MINSIKTIFRYLFLIFTLYLISMYSIGLKDKIDHPNLKNLSTEAYIYIGIILFIFIIMNILFFKNSLKK